MKTQLLTRPRVFEPMDVPAPTESMLRDGEVLVDVIAGGICGSDLPYFGGHPSPLFDDHHPGAAAVPGFPLHEITATVVASRDHEFSVGDHVVGWATNTNALSERIITRGDSIRTLDADLPLGSALVVQPLACVLGILERLPAQPGRVAVIGLGPFGLLFAHALKDRGASWITGVDPIDRSLIAKQYDIDEFVCSTSDRWAAQLPESHRFDLVIEAVGHQPTTLNDAALSLAQDGQIFCFGVPDEPQQTFALRTLFRRNGTLLAGTVLERSATLRAAQDHLRKHPELEQLVSHHFTVDEATAAFELAASPSPDRLKIVIHVRNAEAAQGPTQRIVGGRNRAS